MSEPEKAGDVPKPEMDDGPINWRVFREIWRFGAAEARPLLQEFCVSNRADHAALCAAVDDKNAKLAAATAHRIAGASHAMGAVALSKRCAQLEQLACGGRWSEMPRAMLTVTQEIERLEAYAGRDG